MNTLIISRDILWGVGIFGIFLAVLFIVLFWGTSKMSRYIDEIAFLENAVASWHPTPGNYRLLKNRFELIRYNNQDRERTSRIYTKFFLKYEKYVKAEVFKTEAKKVNQEVEV